MITPVAQLLLQIALAFTAGVWPLDPRPEVVTGFAPPATSYGAGHRGVDLAGTTGQPVRAALDGEVTFAGLLAGRGVVVVSHGATRTTYEPVEPTVRVGDRVRSGEVLGRLAWFGSHCWPAACLHWGLLRGDTYLDPLTLVGSGPVRLLPLAGATPPVLSAPTVTQLTGGLLGAAGSPAAGPVDGQASSRGLPRSSWPVPSPGPRHVGVPGDRPAGAGPW